MLSTQGNAKAAGGAPQAGGQGSTMQLGTELCVIPEMDSDTWHQAGAWSLSSTPSGETLVTGAGGATNFCRFSLLLSCVFFETSPGSRALGVGSRGQAGPRTTSIPRLAWSGQQPQV